MTLDDATLRQRQAADPANSTWLSANAGSGKTRVLTDRVARLLLDKVDPQHILCLTYTKAAAGEMQNRLFRRLGAWALMPDDALAGELHQLGMEDTPDAARLAEARRLFARAIETPGGLRIQTIHSFCAALLRRFPLEAGVTPGFVEMDDRAGELLREQVVEEMADVADSALVDAVAAEYSGEDFGRLTAAILQHREALSERPAFDTVLGWFGVPPGTDMHAVIAAVTDGSEAALMSRLLPILATQSATYASMGQALGAIDWQALTEGDYRTLCGLFLYASGDRRDQSKSQGFPPANHKKVAAALEPVLPELHALMDRVAAARQMELGLRAAQRTHALCRFAAAFLPAYAARKERHGWLDFDDLILKTRHLLTDTAVAAWVLYRLDGGIDHILVDEAQDTSPAQWQVIERLAQEISAGAGARDDRLRTIFVVGDQKQSIYSFQGADPAEFERMRQHFERRLHAGPGLNTLQLEYSFRSSDAVLRLVDAIFRDWSPPGGLVSDILHRAFHPDLPGRIDLWPHVPPVKAAEDLDWFDTADRLAETHHAAQLAREIAARIEEMVATDTLPDGKGGRRPVRAGDVMILVQRRSELFQEIIRACKARGLPVAGADRLKLGAELAVRDLSALLAFLATPEDDLSLAAALRSPLFGWSEGDLHDLAAGREERYLWQALRTRAGDWPDTIASLTELRDDADFLRPYDLTERILTRHDGRRRLLARLGAEAEDGIDALLSQALAYERMEVPSLTGFLTWLHTEDVEIKRQMDSAGDRIRVMTVHGAKGLEAPIVILPDTAKRPVRITDELVTLDGGQPVWRMPADAQPEAVRQALTRLKTAQEQERLRLLYVAITRAEKWLIVCGAGDVGDAGQSWYRLVEEGMQRLGAVAHEFPSGEGLRYRHGDWDSGDVVPRDAAATPAPELPGWARQRAPDPDHAPPPLAPSGLGGEKVLPGEAAIHDGDTARRRGRQIHLLLEHLPLAPPEDWPDLARDLLAIGEDAVTSQEADFLLSHAARVLSASDLGPVFAPGALTEVDLTASLDVLGGRRIHGAVDRLIIAPDRVVAVDFKTNQIVPDAVDNVPEGLLRQMGAYQAALEQIYPGHRVETALLWTAAPRLMTLPQETVKAALRRAVAA